MEKVTFKYTPNTNRETKQNVRRIQTDNRTLSLRLRCFNSEVGHRHRTASQPQHLRDSRTAQKLSSCLQSYLQTGIFVLSPHSRLVTVTLHEQLINQMTDDLRGRLLSLKLHKTTSKDLFFLCNSAIRLHSAGLR